MARAVLFDFWGTLATAPPTVHDDVLKRALAAAKVEHPFGDVKAAWERAQAAEPRDDREVDLEDRFKRVFQSLGIRARWVRSGAKEARQRYVDEMGNATRLFPEGLDAIRALPPGTRVAVVSNFPDTPSFKRTLDRLGLAGRLDASVCSAECGRRKPDPAPFRLALERLGVDAADAVMVGDGEDDVVGALAVGMRAVFVAREGQVPPPGVHATVKDLAGLRDVLPT